MWQSSFGHLSQRIVCKWWSIITLCFCLVASCWEGILKDVWALEKKMPKMLKNNLSSGWVSSFKSLCYRSGFWWETKCECRFRIWTGRPSFRGRSHRRSSRPSEERKMSATLTWSSQLRLPPSRRPASAAPSIARSRTTSRILTMYPTSARVRGHRVLSCPLPATDSEMRRRSDGWLCPAQGGRERLGCDERRGLLLLCPPPLCMFVFSMDGGPAAPSVCDWGSADSDRPLHTHTVSRICRPRDQQIRDTSGF